MDDVITNVMLHFTDNGRTLTDNELAVTKLVDKTMSEDKTTYEYACNHVVQTINTDSAIWRLKIICIIEEALREGINWGRIMSIIALGATIVRWLHNNGYQNHKNDVIITIIWCLKENGVCESDLVIPKAQRLNCE